jgi:hypothetical protein
MMKLSGFIELWSPSHRQTSACQIFTRPVISIPVAYFVMPLDCPRALLSARFDPLDALPLSLGHISLCPS